MFNFIIQLLQSIFTIVLAKRKDVIFTMLLLKKENTIYKRQLNLNKKKICTQRTDRFMLSLIAALSKRAVNHITLVKPKTLLDWQKRFITKYWTYTHKKPGKKPVSNDLKNLILEMKQENHLWGCHRIADELKKLRIDLHPTTVNKIVQTFRKNGKIQPNGSWKKFLKAHWDTLFAMDYATIDTLFGKRLYLLLIMQLHSRKIVACKLTQYPCREFVRQQIIDFSQAFPNSYLVHDNDSQFTSINYLDYGINGIKTCVASPNMNVYIERLIGTIRREALDNFLVISEKQVKNIIENYVRYYNNQRPHQGLNRIPENPILEKAERIHKESVLSGLHHIYFRNSA